MLFLLFTIMYIILWQNYIIQIKNRYLIHWSSVNRIVQSEVVCKKCVVNRKWEVVLLLSFIIDDILKCCLPRTIPEWLNIGSSITIREWIFSRQFSSLEGGERAIAQGGKVKISDHKHCLFHIKEKWSLDLSISSFKSSIFYNFTTAFIMLSAGKNPQETKLLCTR